MKYLYYFENFAQSEKFGNPLTEEEFQKLYNENCKFHKNNFEKEDFVPLYRGIRVIRHDHFTDENVAYYQNPKGHIRKSIEDINIHVTILSETDNWKEFPPYNQSIIGSTSIKDATDYGKLFEIIPFDNTKIGICPKENIWESFGGFSNYNINPIYLVGNFLNGIDWRIKNETNWLKIKGHIRKFIVDKLYNTIFENNIEYINVFFSMYYEYDKNGIINFDYEIKSEEILKEYINNLTNWEKITDFIEEIFKPERFSFESLIYNDNFSSKMYDLFDYRATDSIQIWCGGPVIIKKMFG